MLILNNTTNSLLISTAAAYIVTAPTAYVCWREITATDGYTANKIGYTMAQNNNHQTLISAPSANTQFVIDYLVIVNNDATSNTFTLWDNANSVETEIITVTLSAGEYLQYTHDTGFCVYTINGAVKQSPIASLNPITSAIQMNVLGSDVVNNNATANTIANVTGLSFAVTANLRYRFKFFIPYTSAAGTTGSRWSISGPASPSFLFYRSDYSLTTTSRTLNDQLAAYDLPAASNASSAIGANIAVIQGIVTPTNNGNIIARFASEVANSAITAKAGAFVEFQQY